MKQTDFMKMLDTSWDDIHGIDKTCLGVIMITLYRSADDDLEVQMGANVPEAVTKHALTRLVVGWATGDGPDNIYRAPPPRLKKAI